MGSIKAARLREMAKVLLPSQPQNQIIDKGQGRVRLPLPYSTGSLPQADSAPYRRALRNPPRLAHEAEQTLGVGNRTCHTGAAVLHQLPLFAPLDQARAALKLESLLQPFPVTVNRRWQARRQPPLIPFP